MTSSRLLLVYHSSEGQTAKVAERIASTVAAAGVTVDVEEADGAPGPDGYSAVLLGDSIHMGRHSRALSRYVSDHADQLSTVPIALFQVSLTSATDDEEHSTRAHELIQELVDETGLDPDIVGFFAGSLAYTRYGWFKRRLMRRIARSEGGDVDMTVDHEYTDWDAVDDFARHTAALMASSEESRNR
ncbi:MAG: protoporphyrinogen oxidase [Acidimicrobiia bacterium]|nr:protoporphyrinogen oxidase [Acidimicrobiia bacterium]